MGGDTTAESIKINIGSAFPLSEELTMPVRGRDMATGLPKEIIVTSEEIRKAILPSIKKILSAVKQTVEDTPPELVADLLNRDIVLTGGGSLLRGLDQLMSKETKLQVQRIDDPLISVVRGCGVVLEHIEELKPILVWSAKEAYV